jgi:acyl phosphate:glycerol-3-phosphate acyltransferase
MIIYTLLLFLIAYLIGSVPTGVIFSRLFGQGDLQERGSKNIGATNVSRVMGKKWGILTLLGDGLKGMAAVWIGQWGLSGFSGSAEYPLAFIAFGAFLGHCFPVYLRFKGGKGVATALGIFLVFNPLVVLLVIPIFLATTYFGKYVSLGSMVSALSFPILLLWLHYPSGTVVLSLFIALVILLKHHENIRRIIHGEEKSWN